MHIFLNILKQLSGPAKRWAEANKTTIMRWIIIEGMPVWKVLLRIKNMF